ncbi:hypothetical protein Hanom_Chr12g01132881 [Helianthus anomalus]
MLDEAQKALEEAEALKKLSMQLPPRVEPVTDSSKYTAADVRVTDQKLRVCDICGAFLSVYDSDRRLADHFGGKLHLGYMQIREKLADLLDERTNKRKAPEDDRRSKERSKDLEREGSRDRDRASSRDRDRTRDSDRRSRDRDRHHDRGRGYDRYDRDRERDRDSRSRHRSRSRDRVRDYDRPRRYDRY